MTLRAALPPDAECLYRQVQDAVRAFFPQPHAGTAAPPLDFLVGIRSGGAWIAQRWADEWRLPCFFVDVAFHRDDYTMRGIPSQMLGSNLSQSVDGKTVLLIDDVIGTGRTVRAALNELFDYGRPRQVLLATLVDRGGRELPFEPNFVGQKLTLPRGQLLELVETENQAITKFEFLLQEQS